MDKDILVVLLLGIFVIVSAVQTYQLVTLKATGVAPSLPKAATTSAPSTQSQGASSGGINNLPAMVGGC